MDVKLANPRGFCAGVDRAIEIVSRALDIYGAPIYVRHEVVHNKSVVGILRERGAIFVDEIEDIPNNVTVIFSAHGVSQSVRKKANEKNLKIFDATCPLVTKVHMQVARSSDEGRDCIMIGHQEHPEVEGTMGQYPEVASGGRIYLVESESDVKELQVENPDKISYVTQTTLSVDDTIQIINALRKRFPLIKGPKTDDICYATQNRQDAVRQLALECDLILVVGSANSSNSNRLKELAAHCGVEAYLIDDAEGINKEWLLGKTKIGVTAGASAPEALVSSVIDVLALMGCKIPVE
ncbi:MAG: 4-hydroxy-3-methylbut-2-enyl diphosphate reductase, partial [Alphaproteobacteria bacterium]|nr:4-hydroxy-3-methylbut-2-enyl diphosphate reductase [Alphaproteobacteria bacterium]